MAEALSVPAGAGEPLLATLPGCVPDCHGCPHRGWPAARSLEAKRDYLLRALRPWADRLEPVRSVPADRRFGYRDRVTLKAAFARGQWHFGLVRREEIIFIPECPVHSERVRRIGQLLGRYLPPPERFPLGWLHVAGAQVTLVVRAHRPPMDWVADLAPDLGDAGVEGLWFNGNPSAGRKLFLKTGWHLVFGVPHSVDADGLLHGPGAFQQLLPGLYDEALRAADAAGLGGAGAVLDLYCGTGRSLRHWRRQGSAVLGVESSGDAVACALRNAPGATLLRGSCVTRLPQVREWFRHAGSPGPVAWLNPDRRGLEPEVAATLAAELRPRRVAYLSCSAGTLARDLAVFAAAGYRVAQLLPLDFFPHTRHVEVLALLSR